MRRTGIFGLAYTAYRIWRRLPPQHRRRLMQQARKHGPRVAAKAAKGARRVRRR